MIGRKKVELILAATMLAYLPVAAAREEAGYPTEKVGAFVVNNLDVTSLPSVFRPRKEKGKKTFADYGYTTQKLKDKEVIVQAGEGGNVLSIRTLEVSASGIYTCVAKPAQDGSNPKAQSVILMKRNESNALLKGRETFREFASCPVIGTDGLSPENAYGDGAA